MLDKKECPYCGEEISAEAEQCKFCGEILEKPRNKKCAKTHNKPLLLCAIISFLLSMVALIINIIIFLT